LQILDCFQGIVVGFLAGTSHGIGHHPDVVVMLVRVHRRIVDADVCQSADEIKRLNT